MNTLFFRREDDPDTTVLSINTSPHLLVADLIPIIKRELDIESVPQRYISLYLNGALIVQTTDVADLLSRRSNSKDVLIVHVSAAAGPATVSAATTVSGSAASPDAVKAIHQMLDLQSKQLELLKETTAHLRKSALKDFELKKPQSRQSDSTQNRLNWFTYYGVQQPNNPTTQQANPTGVQQGHCHLLGGSAPPKFVVCAHLFQKRWITHAREFGIHNVNSERNILLLLKPFEDAFDAGQLVFLYEKKTGQYKCKILDPDLKSKTLDKAMHDFFRNSYTTGDVDFKGKNQFSDFDGQPLQFLNGQRPWTRCLTFHALVARDAAIKYGWISPSDLAELDSDDMWSEGYLDEDKRKTIDEWRVKTALEPGFSPSFPNEDESVCS